ncbi:hypothetical protein DFP73DRAFT_584762 [Morchella snyderi]|nr:hypothetical protein DFP73DRAFT_584762 [Morchella snyderi]
MLVQALLPIIAFAGSAFSELVLDRFENSGTNALGNWHGCDGSMSCQWNGGSLTIQSADTDYSFFTQFNNACQDLGSLNSQYLHIKCSGDKQFSIALTQNNNECNVNRAPYPETWDIVNAADYSNGEDIYVPMSHFNIMKGRTLGVAFKAFRNPGASTTFSLIEIVDSAPVNVPEKKPTGPLYFSCTRPNSIAFGIDDGIPSLAEEMMEIVDSEGIKVTFFVVGQSLDDSSLPFKNLYKRALDNGHQIGFHSYTHPKLEGLNSVSTIDDELLRSHDAVMRNLGVDSRYFRAPYGTDGALTRQRLEATVPGTKIINWSVDIEDWIYGPSDPNRQQTLAVQRDLSMGGNLFVAHYLYISTVDQLRQFIKDAKATGKQIMRIDQCLMDPNAPSL